MFGALGCRPRARSVLHCPWCFSPAAPSLDPSCARRKPPARRSKQFGSWQCRTAGKGKVCSWFLGVQKATFGALGCRPRARSALHCHGVLALRHRPWTRAVPDESPLVGGLSAAALVEDSLGTSPRALGHCFFVRFRRHCLSQLVPGVGGMGAPAPLIIPARGPRGPELAVALPYGSSLLSEEKRGRRPCRRPTPPHTPYHHKTLRFTVFFLLFPFFGSWPKMGQHGPT